MDKVKAKIIRDEFPEQIEEMKEYWRQFENEYI